VPGLAIGFEHSFIHQVADFLNSLDEKETDRTDFEDAMQTERVVNAVLPFAKSDKWESLVKVAWTFAFAPGLSSASLVS
jgi:predicted dehydrogenase